MQQLSPSLGQLRLSLVSLLLAAASLLAAAPVVAQQRVIATADIPFDFTTVSGKLPAGRYQILRITDNLFTIRSVDCTQQQNIMFNPDTAPQLPEQNRLVFRQYGSRYFLANLWTAGSRTGLRMV